MIRRVSPGFTLLELVLALAIVGALLVVMFGGLRVGLAAWGSGERRAEALEHDRSLDQLLTRAIGGAYPYQAGAGGLDQNRVLFRGEPDRLSFVTVEPPLPPPVPIAFMAITIGREERTGLVIRQRVLPNQGAFESGVPVVSDPVVTAVQFRYRDGESGEWRERWDADSEDDLPRAVEIRFSTTVQGRPVVTTPLTVPIRATRP